MIQCGEKGGRIGQVKKIGEDIKDRVGLKIKAEHILNGVRLGRVHLGCPFH